MKRTIFILITISILVEISVGASSWEGNRHLVFSSNGNKDYLPEDSLLEFSFPIDTNSVCVDIVGRGNKIINDVDSVVWGNASDTLYLKFSDSGISYANPRLDLIDISIMENEIEIRSYDYPELVISAKGKCNDGRIHVIADTTYTLLLDGLQLKSSHAPAFNSSLKQRVNIILGEGTENYLEDGSKYNFADSTEKANGCLTCLGPITFEGSGVLSVKGNAKHAIYSKKSITIKDGTFIIPQASSDAFHSGKKIVVQNGNFQIDNIHGDAFEMDEEFEMTNGSITMSIVGDASKGIKCGGNMIIKGGTIISEAIGSLENKEGGLSYCTNLKCASDIRIEGGELRLSNHSPGGKCVSGDGRVVFDGGSVYMETSGDGDAYLDEEGQVSYYTSKCLAVGDSLIINHGTINCLSTGLGGKGIDVNGPCVVGEAAGQDEVNVPVIIVETRGTSIVNDTIADERYGCPKAIKVSSDIVVNSGSIQSTTYGMGGEGIECGAAMRIDGGKIECHTFDDGINVESNFDLYDGEVYCCSTDNDGIDSNGKMAIHGGIIAAISMHNGDESFDSDRGRLFIYGGTILGIGRDFVKIGEAEQQYYATPKTRNQETWELETGMNINSGDYIGLKLGTELQMSILAPMTFSEAFVIFSSPQLRAEETYDIITHKDIPADSDPCCNSRVVLGGTIDTYSTITEIETTNNTNY